MSLVIYRNVIGLSTRMLDDLNVYAQPSVSFFCLACGLLNVSILSNKTLKGMVYKHLFVVAIASCVYALNNSFTFIIRCGLLCPYGYSYWSKVYEVYCYIYIAKSLELFILLLEIHLAFQRIHSFSNSSPVTNINLPLRFTFFFLIGFTTCVLTSILSRSITLTGYLDTTYKYSNGTLVANLTQTQLEELQPIYRVIGGDKYSPFSFVLLGLSILQGVGLLMVLLVVNIVIFYKFIRFVERKKNIAQVSGNFHKN